MARIVVELTNRCNLTCQHCFSGRHGGRDDLPLAVLRGVLAEAMGLGFDHLTFTGGDPTLYRYFEEVLRLTSEAGYRFSMVTNGLNFTHRYQQILPYRENLKQITFSLDGASEEVHDRLRGRGSYRRVLQAMSLCLALDIPYSNNMVVTRHNRHEISALVELAAKLGSRGVRFGHLMHSPLTTARGWDFSPMERKAVDAEVWELRRSARIPVAMAPGSHTTEPFPCAPLHLQEVNIDCQGRLTKCCHLSSHGEGVGEGDVIADLSVVGFRKAYRQLVAANEAFRHDKLQHLRSGKVQDSDFSPCWYCANYFRKVDWLRGQRDHPWSKHLWEGEGEAALEGRTP